MTQNDRTAATVHPHASSLVIRGSENNVLSWMELDVDDSLCVSLENGNNFVLLTIKDDTSVISTTSGDQIALAGMSINTKNAWNKGTMNRSAALDSVRLDFFGSGQRW